MKPVFISIIACAFLNVGYAQAAADGANPADKSQHEMPTDANFMKAIAAGGLAEVEQGKLAAQRAAHSDVKRFGEKMVNDHMAANEKLKSLAKEQGVELPTQPKPDHKAEKAKLEAKNGAAFDAAYVQGQIKAHQKTVQLLQHQINAGKNAKVRAFAQEILPTVQHHLEMAKDLESKVTNKYAQR